MNPMSYVLQGCCIASWRHSKVDSFLKCPVVACSSGVLPVQMMGKTLALMGSAWSRVRWI
jgi:hypothetical protein